MLKVLLVALVSNILFLVGGMGIGYYSHPYEVCSEKHVSDENIGECVWLLKNQPALR